MIKLTRNAKAVLSRFAACSGSSERVVRITVGDSNRAEHRYNLRFVESKAEHDAVTDFGSFKLLVDQNDVHKVEGLEIDFVNGTEQAGFKFLDSGYVPDAA